MTENTFADISYEIASQIGRDVDYLRTKSNTTGERLYLTGIELSVLLGTAVAISFLRGVVKGLGESVGKATGKALGNALLVQLDRLLGRTRSVDQENVPLLKTEVEAIHHDLDIAVLQGLQIFVSKRVFVDGRAVAESLARLEVQSTLESFGLPPEKAAAHAQVATQMLSGSIIEKLR